MLGIYPSPCFYHGEHGEFYLEARSVNKIIDIGLQVYINNNAIVIADKN